MYGITRLIDKRNDVFSSPGHVHMDTCYVGYFTIAAERLNQYYQNTPLVSKAELCKSAALKPESVGSSL